MPDVTDLIARVREAQSLLMSGKYRKQADALHDVSAALRAFVPDEPLYRWRVLVRDDDPILVRAATEEDARRILTEQYGVSLNDIVLLTQIS